MPNPTPGHTSYFYVLIEPSAFYILLIAPSTVHEYENKERNILYLIGSTLRCSRLVIGYERRGYVSLFYVLFEPPSLVLRIREDSHSVQWCLS
jgi:hypothetical protein